MTKRVYLIVLVFFIILIAWQATEKHGESAVAAIVLIPIGDIDSGILVHLKRELAEIFDRSVVIGERMSKPDYAYRPSRDQYHSTAILKRVIKENNSVQYERVLGVVDEDLYVEGLNFVFGEAKGKVAVISVTRLRQQYYGLTSDEALFYKRILKEAVHELGHTYGLGHCRDPYCVMYFSNSLLDTDRKGTDFCKDCKRRL